MDACGLFHSRAILSCMADGLTEPVCFATVKMQAATYRSNAEEPHDVVLLLRWGQGEHTMSFPSRVTATPHFSLDSYEFLHLGHFPVSGGDSLPVRMVDTANPYYTRADLRSPDSLSSLCERGGRFRANSSPPRLWLRIPRPGAVVTRWFSLTIWEDRSPYIRTS